MLTGTISYLASWFKRAPQPKFILCPECQDDMWQEGPSGGSGYNIRCTNQHVFTYAPGWGIVDPDRYGTQGSAA